MIKNKKVPKIRFPEFSGDWEEKKLGDVGNIESGNGFPEIEQGGKYGIPLFKVSDMNIKGNENEMIFSNNYVNKDQLLKNKWVPIENFPAIIFAKVGAAIMLNRKRLVKKTFLIDNNLMAYIMDSTWDVYFAKILFENIPLPKFAQIGTLPSYNSSSIKKIDINIPTLPEQQKIGNFFKKLDDSITLQKKKIENLKFQKKGLLQKMFPKNGETVPEVRFPEFSGDWEEKKLGEVIKEFIVPMRDKPKHFSGNIPWTRIEDIEGNYINGSKSGQFVSMETIKKMNLKIIPKGSLIVSASATFGIIAMVNSDLITNQTFIGLVPEKEYNLEFLFSLFKSNKVRRYMKIESAGSTIFYISRESFEKMIILIPRLEEQQKIGNFFKKLDELINLNQRKLENLEKRKKGLLQQMFI